jgi:hypothetical protein
VKRSSAKYTVGDAWQTLESCGVSRDYSSVGGPRGCGDLEVVGTSGPSRSPGMGEQRGVVSCDVEIERDDLDPGEDAFD